MAGTRRWLSHAGDGSDLLAEDSGWPNRQAAAGSGSISSARASISSLTTVWAGTVQLLTRQRCALGWRLSSCRLEEPPGRWEIRYLAWQTTRRARPADSTPAV